MNKLTTALLSSCILLIGASAMAQDAMKKDDMMGKDEMSK
jgi:pentapeptide MXKDX repeat protein